MYNKRTGGYVGNRNQNSTKLDAALIFGGFGFSLWVGFVWMTVFVAPQTGAYTAKTEALLAEMRTRVVKVQGYSAVAERPAFSAVAER